jgi:hypothetical protein
MQLSEPVQLLAEHGTGSNSILEPKALVSGICRYEGTRDTILFLGPNLLSMIIFDLLVRVPAYRSRGLGLIPGTTRFSEK